MKKRAGRILLALLCAGAFLTGGVWLLTCTLGNHEMLFESEPASFWATQITNSDLAISNHANQLLNAQIIPRLSDIMLNDFDDSNLRLTLIDTLNSLPGVFIYFIPAEGRRTGAANALGNFGPAAKAAIPALIRVVKSQDEEKIRGEAAMALGKIHSEPETVIPVLIIYTGKNELNQQAANGLAYFGSAAKAAVPNLLIMLKIADPEVQLAARNALKQIDPEVYTNTLPKNLETR